MTWKAIHASATGTGHQRLQTACQDACAFGEFVIHGTPCLVAALSDGAGSAAEGAIGAETAVDAVMAAISSAPADAGAPEPADALRWLEEVRRALESKAAELGLELRDLACTLLACRITESNAVFVQVGDGAWVTGAGDAFEVVAWPEPGEYANETCFMTSAPYLEKAVVSVKSGPIDTVAGLTDGLQRLALDYATRRPFPGFFRPMLEALRGAAEPGDLVAPLVSFLDSDRVNERTDDDKTLFLAVRAGAEAAMCN